MTLQLNMALRSMVGKTLITKSFLEDVEKKFKSDPPVKPK